MRIWLIDGCARVIGLLECCSKYGGERLKRFILMGSTSAIENTLRDESKPVEKPYSEEDWNPVRFCPFLIPIVIVMLDWL